MTLFRLRIRFRRFRHRRRQGGQGGNIRSRGIWRDLADWKVG
jgi:hypothetical protein